MTNKVPKFIAEVSSNHNKNLDRSYKLIQKAKEAGCYAVKFQLFKRDLLFHHTIIKKSKSHRSLINWELPPKFIPKLSIYAKKIGIKFSCSAFYIEAVDLLKDHIDFFKIGSYEILWLDLLKKIAKTKKKVIISTGMSNLKEISNAVNTLKKYGSRDITILHCISQYPAELKNCNLKSIDFLRKKYDCKVGWSDHTNNILLVYRACEKFNADYVEIHFDLNDQKGKESKIGHCWSSNKVKELLYFLKNQKNLILN